MKPALLMFDLDGTLVDTLPDMLAQANQALVEAGLEPGDSATFRRSIGYGPVRLLAGLAGAAVDQATMDLIVRRFRELYRAHMTDNSRPYSGIAEALNHLAATPKIVITNKTLQSTESLLTALGLRNHFCAVYGGDSFEKSKPHPLPLLEACRRAGIDPACAVLIGDGDTDIQAARAAGCKSALVLWGYGGPRLKALSPDFVAETPGDLMRLFG